MYRLRSASYLFTFLPLLIISHESLTKPDPSTATSTPASRRITPLHTSHFSRFGSFFTFRMLYARESALPSRLKLR